MRNPFRKNTEAEELEIQLRLRGYCFVHNIFRKYNYNGWEVGFFEKCPECGKETEKLLTDATESMRQRWLELKAKGAI